MTGLGERNSLPVSTFLSNAILQCFEGRTVLSAHSLLNFELDTFPDLVWNKRGSATAFWTFQMYSYGSSAKLPTQLVLQRTFLVEQSVLVFLPKSVIQEPFARTWWSELSCPGKGLRQRPNRLRWKTFFKKIVWNLLLECWRTLSFWLTIETKKSLPCWHTLVSNSRWSNNVSLIMSDQSHLMWSTNWSPQMFIISSCRWLHHVWTVESTLQKTSKM